MAQIPQKPSQPLLLPLELLYTIFLYTPPTLSFHIGVILSIHYHYPDIRDNAIPLLPSASMDAASKKGQTHLLRWWVEWKRKRPSRQLMWSENAMDWASAEGRVTILEWWKNSGLEAKHSEKAMLLASKRGHVAVLEWWRRSGIPLRYLGPSNPMDYASAEAHVAVLDWWKGSGLELRWSASAIDYASANGHIEVLEWWKHSGLEPKFSKWGLEQAKLKGHMEVVKWWKANGLKVQGQTQANYDSGFKVVRGWWKRSYGSRWTISGT
ncbi:hypothetical protein HDV00_009919 [Rhizophlyctis rosea]|nr:hypothetical protein HDV00_009919 [Rhizophlyctis rosea]